MVEIVHGLRTQMAGTAKLAQLARAFAINDVTGSGMFNSQDFEDILAKVGLFARRQELNKLYRHFDTERKDELNYRSFLAALQGDVNARRMAMIRLVWDTLACNQPRLGSKLVIGAFTASAHPSVLAGEKSEEQVFREFVASFASAGNHHEEVTWEQFADYYCAISASVPYDDDQFCKELERAWSVKENTQGSSVSTVLIRKIENVVREKLRQRVKQDGSEAEKLRLTFKYYDDYNSGMIEHASFLRALTQFGIHLADDVSSSLFADFESSDGQIDYAEFCAKMYQGEATLPSYTGLAQTVPATAAARRTAIFLIGSPAAGTPGFANRLKLEFGLTHLNAYDLVNGVGGTREAMTKLAPDVAAAALVQAMDAFSQQGKMHFLIDGFPSSLQELEAWELAVERASVDVPVAILLELPTGEMRKRLAQSGKEEWTDRIIQSYELNTLAVVGNLSRQNRLATVNANSSDTKAFEELRAIVDNVLRL